MRFLILFRRVCGYIKSFRIIATIINLSSILECGSTISLLKGQSKSNELKLDKCLKVNLNYYILFFKFFFE